MPESAGQAAFQFTYQVSPILLTGGIAAGMPGGILPIVALTQPNGMLDHLNQAFAQFVPLPGATLIDNDVGTYPFANQDTAANALITKPLAISMRMIVPARDNAGFALKTALMQSLVSSLQQHNIGGGLYTVMTPSAPWANCIMLTMRDVTGGEGKQAQVEWQFDFYQPLITLQQAQQAENILMSKLTAGSQVLQNNNGQIASGGSTPSGGPLSQIAPPPPTIVPGGAQ